MLTKLRTDEEYEKAVARMRLGQSKQSTDETVASVHTYSKADVYHHILTALSLLFLCAISVWLYLNIETDSTYYAVTFFAIGLSIIIIQKIYKRRKYADNLVKNTSRQYKDLLQLNELVSTTLPVTPTHMPYGYEYRKSDTGVSISAHYTCNSKRQFDQFNAGRVMRSYIKSENIFFSNWVHDIRTMRSLEQQYTQKLCQIKGKNDISWDALSKKDKKKIKRDKYYKIVYRLLQQNTIEFMTDLAFTVTYSYTSPAGRNHYADAATIRFDMIQRICEQKDPIPVPSGKSGSSRAERASKPSSQAFRQEQRSLMRPKLRYKILKRDNFRCVLCGCTADESIARYGHGFEVDHITPVSRGGLTVEDNLRTLCFGCNRGKGAEIEKNVG